MCRMSPTKQRKQYQNYLFDLLLSPATKFCGKYKLPKQQQFRNSLYLDMYLLKHLYPNTHGHLMSPCGGHGNMGCKAREIEEVAGGTASAKGHSRKGVSQRR